MLKSIEKVISNLELFSNDTEVILDSIFKNNANQFDLYTFLNVIKTNKEAKKAFFKIWEIEEKDLKRTGSLKDNERELLEEGNELGEAFKTEKSIGLFINPLYAFKYYKSKYKIIRVDDKKGWSLLEANTVANTVANTEALKQANTEGGE